MKISLAWLGDYVELPPSVDVLAEALTSGGTEVIGRENHGNIPDKIVVAEILSSEQHPNADRLSVCQLEDGSGEPRQIVCGAKNYQVGDKVPLALPGALLGKDFKIKRGKLRGIKSDGMMCSAKELNLSADGEGLLILPATAPVGQELKNLFSPDTILDLEVTPNRPDLLGYLGVAREVGALTEETPRVFAPSLPQTKAAESFLKLQDEGCPMYSARLIRGIKVGPSPKWLVDRLVAHDLRPINNVVDVTNYVLLETGQPLHAFDEGKLNGAIGVRSAAEGETLQALDGSLLKLRTGDLVIADEGQAVALAGVIGGSATAVTEETVDILLEAAWFEPARVRRTSRQLGLQTDSSYRFERRVDPAGVLAASARAVQLITETAGGTADSEVLLVGEVPLAPCTFTLNYDRCRSLLGLEIGDKEISSILSRLGLVASSDGAWTIPSFRSDLTREVDLIEEVIRIAGIDRVPARLRGFPSASSQADLRYDRAELMRERLRAQGFSEARTSHFVSPEVLDKIGIMTDKVIKMRNPLGADQALLRPTLLGGLLTAMAHNLRHHVRDVRLFELGRVFALAEAEEKTSLALIATGKKDGISWQTAGSESDLYDVKGVLQAALGPLSFAEAEVGGLVLKIEGDGVEGTVRQLPRGLSRDHEARQPVYYAEVFLDSWMETSMARVQVSPLPKFPAMERDLSFVLPCTTQFSEVELLWQGMKGPHLESVVLKDVFSDSSGEKLPVGQRSLTVTLTFRDGGRTLNSDEVDRAVAALRDHAKAELNVVFRE